MTNESSQSPKRPTKEEAIKASAEIYAAILADPYRAAEIRKARAEHAEQLKREAEDRA